MRFCIADTFTKALQKLTSQEQKAAKTTVFDLQVDPGSPGMQFHRIDKSRDPNFWSVRANQDIRIIVHKTEASFLVCYVDHHPGLSQRESRALCFWSRSIPAGQHPFQ